MKQLLARLKSNTKGNVLMMAAAGTVAVVGGAGLGVDTVQWYLWKRQLQQAVDSGAIAGALSVSRGGTATTPATNEINRNANTVLTIENINTPPTSGAFIGNNRAVEVIVTTQQGLPFSSLFVDVAPEIRARSVAATVTDGEHCVISLAPDGIGVSTQGNADVQLGCGVAANSNDYTAIDLDGTSYLGGSPLSAVGGIQYASGNIATGTDIQSYGLPQTDPMLARGLTVPTSPSGCTQNNFRVQPSDTATISPGRYCNGITVRGDLTMNPGVYIVDRGTFYASSQSTITGHGVTIILTGNAPGNIANVDMLGGAEVDLSAPTPAQDATWEGVLFFQDPTADYPLSKFAGDSDFEMEGIVYMPNGNVKFTGDSGQHADCLLLIGYRVTFAGDSSFDNNCPSHITTLDLGNRRVRVVE
ncbi:MAG: Tad domain-containing protein [Novosphingobium sp.]|nr:Tad domain-containing protein [Novosphingobium sp.]